MTSCLKSNQGLEVDQSADRSATRGLFCIFYFALVHVVRKASHSSTPRLQPQWGKYKQRVISVEVTKSGGETPLQSSTYSFCFLFWWSLLLSWIIVLRGRKKNCNQPKKRCQLVSLFTKSAIEIDQENCNRCTSTKNWPKDAPGYLSCQSCDPILQIVTVRWVSQH